MTFWRRELGASQAGQRFCRKNEGRAPVGKGLKGEVESAQNEGFICVCTCSYTCKCVSVQACT